MLEEVYRPLNDPTFYDNEPAETETEGYRFKFRDGSAIILHQDEESDLELPHRKTKRLWMAEEADNHIYNNEIDFNNAIKYLNNHYGNL